MSHANKRKPEVKPDAEVAGGSLTSADDLFGPPPLLEGENEAAYFDLLEKVKASVKPRDILEEIATRDFVDITWEIIRLRRIRQPVIVTGYKEALETVLKLRHGFIKAGHLSDSWLSGSESARVEVNDIMEAAGLTMSDVHARAIQARIKTLERIDRMTAQAEHRRRLVIGELDRRREALARRLREAANVIDVELSAEETKAPQLTTIARAS